LTVSVTDTHTHRHTYTGKFIFCPCIALDRIGASVRDKHILALATSIRRSALCCGVTSTDVNTLAEQYDAELTTILDPILPLRTSTRRRRPSDPWFDNDCRNAKRLYRKLERRASRSASDASVWKQQRRVYRHLISQKREAFWQNLIAQQNRTPRRM